MFATVKRLASVLTSSSVATSRRRPPRTPASKRFHLEQLEARELLAADWFSTYIADPNVANLLRNDWNGHGAVTRNDMLAVFSQIEKSSTISANQLNSLKFLSSYGNLLNMPAPTQALTGEVVSTTDPANLHYQGMNVGYLSANAPSWKLQDLVNKWFLGADHPSLAAGTSGTYQATSGTLFGSGGPKYTDVFQGQLGDCTYLSSLAETAARTTTINSMFTANGDGTWSVRLYRNGSPVYVTVDSYLPNRGGLYDHPSGGVLWAALAEKAVVEVNEEGWLGTVQSGVNSYNAINNGNANTAIAALQLFSGRSASSVGISSNASNIAADMAAGKLVVILTGNSTGQAYIEHNHAYAVVAYNASQSQPFTVFNPWGINGGNDAQNGHFIWGQFTANGAALQAYFVGAAQTSAAPQSHATTTTSDLVHPATNHEQPVTQLTSSPTPAAADPFSEPVDVLSVALPLQAEVMNLSGLPQQNTAASPADLVFADLSSVA